MDKIKNIMDKYCEAQTSDSEDKEIRRVIMGEDPEVPDDLEARLSRQIDIWNTVEKKSIRKANITSMHWITGIAASLLVLFSLGFFLNQRTDEEEYAKQEKTCTNPDDAYAETAKALKTFSQAMKHGEELMNK
jgi:hypothetical protein